MNFSDIPRLFPDRVKLSNVREDFAVLAVRWDFNRVSQGDLYVGLEREEFDERFSLGNSLLHWPEAKRKGAGGLICASRSESFPLEEDNFIVADNPNALMGELLREIHGDPFSRLKVVGVTGTNGKTTTSQLIETVLSSVGAETGVFGTIGCHYADRYEPPGSLSNPTADRLFFHGERMVERNVDHLVMEVTSQGMDFHRNDAVDFDVAVFTNLTEDHLDHHRTFEKYVRAKARFFERLGNGKKRAHAVINCDDAAGFEMRRSIPSEVLRSGKVRLLSYGIRNKEADLTAFPLELREAGSTSDLFFRGRPLGKMELTIPGIFNVYNALAAVGTGFALGISAEKMLRALKEAELIVGRFEKVPNTGGVHVYIDYAHTPDALGNILKAARPLVEGSLICLFGCGGNRDAGKRPKMGKIAADHSDLVWITSDNPRDEEPEAIIRDILQGIGDRSKVLTELDRGLAIRKALAEARTGDGVVLAGKGHERVQIVGKRKVPFSDREEVIRFFGWRIRRAGLKTYRSRLAENLDLIFADKPIGLAVFAVVKDEGLGFGLVEMSRTAIEKGCALLCVSCLSEALRIRDAGIVHPVLVLGERFEEELPVCVEKNLGVQVQSFETAAKLASVAKNLKSKAGVHFKVDSGMGRYGVRWNRAAEIYRRIRELDGLRMEGIMSHFARSDELDKEYANLQFERFRGVLEELGDLLPPYRHVCNTGGYLDLPACHLNAVRIGTLLTGVYPSKVCRRIEVGGRALRPVYDVETRVAFCKRLEPGDKVGYGMHFTATRRTRVAVLSVGYGDGYPRLRNRGEVIIKGKRFPIVGGVALDATMVDLSGDESVSAGDRVVLVGRENGASISFSELADWAGTVTYDVMTRWSSRMEKLAVDG